MDRSSPFALQADAHNHPPAGIAGMARRLIRRLTSTGSRPRSDIVTGEPVAAVERLPELDWPANLFADSLH
jgi:hypothetical protein